MSFTPETPGAEELSLQISRNSTCTGKARTSITPKTSGRSHMKPVFLDVPKVLGEINIKSTVRTVTPTKMAALNE